MPFVNPYYSCNIISEIYNNNFYIIYGNIVYAYGKNDYGQLGIGSDEEKIYIPEKVIIEEKIKDIKIHKHQTWFITFDDKIYACGENYIGPLGMYPYYKISYIPQKVLIEEKIKDSKSDSYQTYYITFYGNVYICGKSIFKYLGIGSAEHKIHTPQKIKN